MVRECTILWEGLLYVVNSDLTISSSDVHARVTGYEVIQEIVIDHVILK